jgi:hypothetical protein
MGFLQAPRSFRGSKSKKKNESNLSTVIESSDRTVGTVETIRASSSSSESYVSALSHDSGSLASKSTLSSSHTKSRQHSSHRQRAQLNITSASSSRRSGTSSHCSPSSVNCPKHPFVQLKRLSRKTGCYKTLLHTCPLCEAFDDGVSMSVPTSLNKHTNQRQKNKSKKLVQSVPARHIPSTGDSLADHVDQNHQDYRKFKNYMRMALKISELIEDNSKLQEKCQQLERDLDESSSRREDGHQKNNLGASTDFGTSTGTLQLENEQLHLLMGEFVKNQHDMNAKTSNYIQIHEEKVNEYEQELATLREELYQAKLSKLALEEENMILKDTLEEASAQEEFYEDELADMATLRDDAHKEKEEAYRTCSVLQREINLLRQQLSPGQMRLYEESSQSLNYIEEDCSSEDEFSVGEYSDGSD